MRRKETLQGQFDWIDGMALWGDAPSEDLRALAKSWLSVLAMTLGEAWKPADCITGSSSNGVVFEWFHGKRKISVFLDEEEISCLKVWGPNCSTEMEDADAAHPGFLAIWDWLWEDPAL